MLGSAEFRRSEACDPGRPSYPNAFRNEFQNLWVLSCQGESLAIQGLQQRTSPKAMWPRKTAGKLRIIRQSLPKRTRPQQLRKRDATCAAGLRQMAWF